MSKDDSSSDQAAATEDLTTDPDPVQIADTESDTAASSATESVSEPVSESVPEPESEPASELASEPVPEPEPLADGQTRISLTFSGDCWTEISDATGQRLFFEMGRTGRNVDLTGTAPFAVLFGNVENVSVRVDDSDYPISPSTPGSRTARLTIIEP